MVFTALFRLLSASLAMACLASVCASKSILRAKAASCTIRYAEDLPGVALDAFDSGEVDLDSPCGPVVAVCVSAAVTTGGLTCRPFPDGQEAVASWNRWRAYSIPPTKDICPIASVVWTLNILAASFNPVASCVLEHPVPVSLCVLLEFGHSFITSLLMSAAGVKLLGKSFNHWVVWVWLLESFVMFPVAFPISSDCRFSDTWSDIESEKSEASLNMSSLSQSSPLGVTSEITLRLFSFCFCASMVAANSVVLFPPLGWREVLPCVPMTQCLLIMEFHILCFFDEIDRYARFEKVGNSRSGRSTTKFTQDNLTDT